MTPTSLLQTSFRETKPISPTSEGSSRPLPEHSRAARTDNIAIGRLSFPKTTLVGKKRTLEKLSEGELFKTEQDESPQRVFKKVVLRHLPPRRHPTVLKLTRPSTFTSPPVVSDALLLPGNDSECEVEDLGISLFDESATLKSISENHYRS
ncbi:MAG: hypothetical protein JSR76_00010 [Verrucomicrobia bacterium]|nr:hypothetical protein [Verrucomicrobiota bacterium]